MPDGSGEGQTAKVVGNDVGGPKRVWKPVTRNQVHPDSAFQGSPRGAAESRSALRGRDGQGLRCLFVEAPGFPGDQRTGASGLVGTAARDRWSAERFTRGARRGPTGTSCTPAGSCWRAERFTRGAGGASTATCRTGTGSSRSVDCFTRGARNTPGKTGATVTGSQRDAERFTRGAGGASRTTGCTPARRGEDVLVGRCDALHRPYPSGYRWR